MPIKESHPLKNKITRWLQKYKHKLFNQALGTVLNYHPDVRRSNLVRYAEDELRRAGYFNQTGLYGDMLGHAVMRQVKMFALEGHSGMSGSIARSAADRVIAFNPLTDLTGDDSEWNEVGPGVFQNRRLSSIFKQDGQAYRIDGKVFREPDGGSYTSRDSRVFIDFPWSYSEPEIVNVEKMRR